ncbi:3-hydroxyacyl-CoA dehydrogenase family protein [Halomicroarcula sp. GCM10025817]
MHETHRVGVFGAGDMGHGLAAHFAVHGHDVTVLDHRQSNLDAARDRIHDVVSFLNDEDVTDHPPDAVTSDIEYTLDTASGLSGADVVIESVPEDLDVKHQVFQQIAEAAPGDAVLASNTSGLPITDIAAGVADHAERVVGCHWWYPPYLLPTVEVVRGAETSDETVERVESLLRSVDRDPVLVNKDVPGFVWNRIQMAIFRESLHIVEEGIASAADVNKAIRDGYALRTAAIGPLETIDIAGLDLVQTVLDDLSPHLCNDDEANPLLEAHLSAGRDGIHSGGGIFEYDDSPDEITQARDERVMAIRRALEATRADR